MNDSGARLFGHTLDLPETAVTVRVRAHERTVTPGQLPTSEAYLAGLNVIECADLDAALASLASVAQAPLAPGAAGATTGSEYRRPYLLCGWIGRSSPPTVEDRRLVAEIERWRGAMDAQGLYLMGSSFGGVEASVALRLRDAPTLLQDTPFIEIGGESACIDVVVADSGRSAIARAATHPLAGAYAIEVRPFSD